MKSKKFEEMIKYPKKKRKQRNILTFQNGTFRIDVNDRDFVWATERAFDEKSTQVDLTKD